MKSHLLNIILFLLCIYGAEAAIMEVYPNFEMEWQGDKVTVKVMNYTPTEAQLARGAQDLKKFFESPKLAKENMPESFNIYDYTTNKPHLLIAHNGMYIVVDVISGDTFVKDIADPTKQVTKSTRDTELLRELCPQQ